MSFGVCLLVRLLDEVLDLLGDDPYLPGAKQRGQWCSDCAAPSWEVGAHLHMLHVKGGYCLSRGQLLSVWMVVAIRCT
jgi:hypothetical protein